MALGLQSSTRISFPERQGSVSLLASSGADYATALFLCACPARLESRSRPCHEAGRTSILHPALESAQRFRGAATSALGRVIERRLAICPQLPPPCQYESRLQDHRYRNRAGSPTAWAGSGRSRLGVARSHSR